MKIPTKRLKPITRVYLVLVCALLTASIAAMYLGRHGLSLALAAAMMALQLMFVYLTD